MDHQSFELTLFFCSPGVHIRDGENTSPQGRSLVVGGLAADLSNFTVGVPLYFSGSVLDKGDQSFQDPQSTI